MDAERRMEAAEKHGQRSAVSEHEDRKAMEETVRGEGRVEADEAGTAMALRGEHDARLAITHEEWRMSRETNLPTRMENRLHSRKWWRLKRRWRQRIKGQEPTVSEHDSLKQTRKQEARRKKGNSAGQGSRNR